MLSAGVGLICARGQWEQEEKSDTGAGGSSSSSLLGVSVMRPTVSLRPLCPRAVLLRDIQLQTSGADMNLTGEEPLIYYRQTFQPRKVLSTTTELPLATAQQQ